MFNFTVMKKGLLLFFILTVSLKVSAQDTIRVSQNELLNGENALARLTKNDTNRVKLLIDYANLCFYNLDFLNGLKAVNEARSISKEIKFAKGEGLYLKSISIFRRRVNTFYELTQHAINIKNLDIYYEVEGNRILGQYTNFDVFGFINMPSGTRDSEIETIKSNLEEALNFYSNKENLQSRAYLLEALSLVYYHSNKEKSNEYKREAQSLFRKLGQSYHELIILSNDINSLSGQGKEEEAKALEIEAIDIYTKESDKMIKAHCAFLLSRIYGWLNREKNLQLEYLFQAEEILAEINEKDLLKSVYLSAASVYEWFFTNSEKALEYEYKELNLRKEINYYESVAYTYLLISESLFGLNRIQDFPPEYKDYLKTGSLENSSFFDAEVLWVRARMLEAQGKSMEAQSVFRESITVYMTLKDKNGACWAAHDLAQSFKSAGDLKNAIKNAQLSFDLANEINLLTIQIRSSDLLSQLYEQAGQKDKAFSYLQQYRAFKDENDRLNNIAQRSELEMQSVLKKRQREIEQLETETQLKEQENKTQRVWLFSIAGVLASLLLLFFVLVRNNRQKQNANQVLNSKNKELEIEAALERVRARTMAMQKTDELDNVVKIMYRQFEIFGMADWGCAIMIFNKNVDRIEYWVAESTNADLSCYFVNGQEHPIYKKLWKHWEEQDTTITLHHTDEFKKEFDKYWLNETDFKRLPEEVKASVLADREIYLTYAPMQYGFLNATGKTQLPKDQIIILERFAKVFEQTYTRFLDLQKAEAQAREAEIELALERVRAKTMAMHSSDELREIVLVINRQLEALDFESISCNIIIIDKDTGDSQFWASGFTKDIHPKSYHVPYIDHPYYDAMLKPWKEGKKYVVYEYEAEGKKSFDEIWFTKTEFKNASEEVKKAMISLPTVSLSTAFFSNGSLQVVGTGPVPDEKAVILQRFAKVFEQAYTRFLDLQKAEAQAREAQIEACLERVRSRSMAMHKSEELSEVVKLLYSQMEPFGVSTFGISIAIFREEENAVEFWFADHLDSNLLQSYKVVGQKNRVFRQNWEDWKNKTPQTQVYLEGQEKWDFDTFILEETDFVKLPEELKQDLRTHKTVCFTFTFFNYGYFESVDLTIPGEKNTDVLIRFAKVFEQTYTRFLDLQKAEAQTREAQIEAALERVRSRSMAMHKSDELEQVVEALTDQFKILNAGTVTCWIALVHVETNTMEIWNHTNMGSPKSNYTVNGKDFHTFQADIEAFKNKERFRQFSFEKDVAKRVLKEQLEFELIIPEESTDYHLLQYRHHFGFIGYASWSEPGEQGHSLLQRFAKVFEQTYTRFLDLQKAEAQALRTEQDLVEIKAARKKAEETLEKLKSTQAQLIQSEKMASLGELTAGIAHEIQNPLNFINNFSEVSSEMIDELNEELGKGELEEVKSISGDLKENLNKINHHGNRASSIVKGMLEHSRNSSGKKEPTDINALAEEYLRLAYHAFQAGMRAKDQSFNAVPIAIGIKTNLDPDLPLVDVVPQEFGRVLLNLINNAFQAIDEKAKKGVEGYKPELVVSTRQDDHSIQIIIADNGPGIPDEIKDKIFQPFFTTKPTGKGTGLGLSLAYDIVKGHGGTIEVKTHYCPPGGWLLLDIAVNEGSEFLIKIPIAL